MSSPLRLLDLPHVVVQSILREFDLDEMYNFSIVSQKSKHVSQLLSRRARSFELKCGVAFYMMLGFQKTSLSSLSISDLTSVTELMEKVLVFDEVYKSPRVSITLDPELLKLSKYSELLSYVKRVPRKDLQLMSGGKEELWSLLNNIGEGLGNLTIKCTIASRKYLDFPPFECKNLSIESAFWMGPETLEKIDFEHGNLLFCHFTMGEINRFLKNWNDGKFHQKLQKVTFRRLVMEENIELITEGFDCKQGIIKEGNKGQFKIERNDGKTATVQFERDGVIGDIHVSVE